MSEPDFYHAGNRLLQDEFGSRALADRLEGFNRAMFTEADREFVEGLPFFFLATADAEGRPDCSFKGGMPGFVRITGPAELAFPDYDGNGMFRSLGNLAVNPEVGLLFMTMDAAPRRLRVNGTAAVLRDDPLLGEFPGAQLIVRVTARAIFANCARYIPDLDHGAPAPHAPRAGIETPDAEWKAMDMFRDVLPAPRDTFGG
jgi:predicted pyridoxine 5'-phosphate oxidase superfamily flavin-nucleotide-binding protein